MEAEELDQIEAEIDDILDWMLSYQRLGGSSSADLPGGSLALANPGAEEARLLGEEWDQGSSTGLEANSTSTQRERIIRAAAMVTGERGYASLSIPAITRVARVSNETFYQHFRSTEEAFIAAVEKLGLRVLARIVKAVDTKDTWAEAIRAGGEELGAYLAENPALARLLFVEAFGAGQATVERVDLMLDLMAAAVGFAERPGAGGKPLPRAVTEAIPGGCPNGYPT